MKRIPSPIACLCASLLLLSGNAGSQGLPDLGELERSGLSHHTERRLGERYMLEIRRDPSYIHDPEIADYLNRLGQKLASHGYAQPRSQA